LYVIFGAPIPTGTQFQAANLMISLKPAILKDKKEL